MSRELTISIGKKIKEYKLICLYNNNDAYKIQIQQDIHLDKPVKLIRWLKIERYRYYEKEYTRIVYDSEGLPIRIFNVGRISTFLQDDDFYGVDKKFESGELVWYKNLNGNHWEKHWGVPCIYEGRKVGEILQQLHEFYATELVLSLPKDMTHIWGMSLKPLRVQVDSMYQVFI